MKLLLSLCLLLATGNLAAEKKRLGEMIVDGKPYVTVIESGRVDALVELQGDSREAPIKVMEAFSTATKYAFDQFLQYQQMGMNSIKLDHKDFLGKELLFYDIKLFAIKDAGKPEVFDDITVEVLMDGKPVEIMPKAEWDKLQKAKP